MKLYSYWRSSTSYRVRIALNLKGLPFETVPIDLIKGEQGTQDYKALNPIAGVPTLVLDDGTTLTQSMAILDWLEAEYPEPALLPHDPIEAAHARAGAMIFACDVHPVNNLKVVQKLKAMGHSQDDVVSWMRDWMAHGLEAYQSVISRDAPFSFGQSPTIADICLVAQLYNAHRWGCDLAPFARLTKIEAHCLSLSAFDSARPENQPDAV